MDSEKAEIVSIGREKEKTGKKEMDSKKVERISEDRKSERKKEGRERYIFFILLENISLL